MPRDKKTDARPLEKIEFYKQIFVESFKNDPTYLGGIGIIVFILSATLFLGYILRKYPTTRGGGVIFVTKAVTGDIPFSSSNKRIFKEILYRLIGALTALTAGFSFGIESPSIELGGEVGQGVGNSTRSIEDEKKYLITSGAAAGLSAAFGAPFAGMTFALEQITTKTSLPIIMVIFIATTISSQVVTLFFGREPFFHIVPKEILEVKEYYLIIIFAFLISVLGKIFFKVTVFFKKIHKKFEFFKFFHQLFPVIVSVLLTFFFFDLTGEGYALIDKMISGPLTLKYLTFLFIGKFLFFIYSFSTEIPGGSFVPLLCLGSILGKLYGTFITTFFKFSTELIPLFILLGMCLFLIAILRTPITGVVLVMEITGAVTIFFPLAIGTIFTMLFVESFRMDPLYDSEIAKEKLKN